MPHCKRSAVSLFGYAAALVPLCPAVQWQAGLQREGMPHSVLLSVHFPLARSEHVWGSRGTCHHCWCLTHGRWPQKQVEEQRQVIQSVVALMPVPVGTTDCRFIESGWLTQWANAPPNEICPIDNQELLCIHSCLDPTVWSDSKRISVAAWEELLHHCRGGPQLGLQDLCEECTLQNVRVLVAKCAPPQQPQ